VTSVKKPWWQATKTPKGAFVMSGVWLVVALGQWAVLVVDRDEAWPLVLLRTLVAVLATALAAVYLASGVLLRRRQGADDGAPDRGVNRPSR
jgi:hypothetical protein